MAATKRNIKFGTIMNLSYLIGTIMVIFAIGRLVWWSYNETLKLSAGVTGSEFSTNLAVIVQLGPLVFLLARRIFIQHEIMRTAAKILFWLAIVFNLADMVTNFLAYAIGGYVLPEELLIGFTVTQIPPDAAWVVVGAKWFGYFVCAAVTWGEEGIVWLVAIAGHFVCLILLDLGQNPPLWMSITHTRQPQAPPVAAPAPQAANNGSHSRGNGNGRVRQRPTVPGQYQGNRR